MLDDVAQPILTAVATILAATDAAHIQVYIIAKDQKMVGFHLVPGHQSLHGFARQVHVGLGLCQENFLPRNVYLHRQSLMFRFPILVGACKHVESHKAGIVMRILVLRTRISKTYNNIHGANITNGIPPKGMPSLVFGMFGFVSIR